MKNLIILIAFFSTTLLQAQSVIVNLRMNPNVSPYIDEWIEGNLDAELFLTNNSMAEREVYLKVEIYLDGQLVASNGSDFADLNLFNLSSGLNVYTPGDFFNYVSFDEDAFPQKEKEYITTTKRLLPGTYEICLQVIDPETFEPLSDVIPDNPACFPSIIMNYTPPSLVFPQDETIINLQEQSTTTFQWTGIVPQYPEQTWYEIKLYERFPEQSKEQAALVNQSIWEKKTPFTQTFIDFSYIPLDPEQDYVWQVQAMDEDDFPIGNNEGKSEVWGFGTGSLVNAMSTNNGGVNYYEGLEILGPYEMTIMQLPDEGDLLPCCENIITFSNPAKPCENPTIIYPDCCPPKIITAAHRIITTGGQGGFRFGSGMMLMPGDNSCPYSRVGNKIRIKMEYAIFTDCELVPNVCHYLSDFDCDSATVEPVVIESLIYKNGRLIGDDSSSFPYISNVSYTNSNDTLETSGGFPSIDSTDYLYTCIELNSGRDTAACAALFSLEFDIILDPSSSGSMFRDEYQLATIISDHGGHQHNLLDNVNTNLLINIANEKEAMVTGDNSSADHIDIVPLLIKGTKRCRVLPDLPKKPAVQELSPVIIEDRENPPSPDPSKEKKKRKRKWRRAD